MAEILFRSCLCAMQSVFFIYLQFYKGFETSQIATAFSLLVFTSQAFSLFAGSWGDSFGRYPIMMLGCLLDALAYILLLTTKNYPLLLLATFFFGLGSTLFSTNARAFLLANIQDTGDSYQLKTKAQGKFLKVSSLSAMVAPLLTIPFIFYRKAEWLIWISCCIEIIMLFVMFKTAPKTHECANGQCERFKFGALKGILNEQFIFVHLLLFIPLGLGSAFYIIFPYIFTNLLDKPELVSVSFFVNNLIAVLLQSDFSRKLNLTVHKLIYIAPILIILQIMPWFYALQWLSTITAFLYLVIFATITVYANTALSNMLVKLDNGKNQGLMFGSSKLILAITTLGVMNVLPYIFLI
ncbi:MFS transporter [Mannheimia haemolytica]|nr:MFS transporter [Mannheimia haemolytica]TRC46568.1 MFS transporter [Mannheimia haemolytica]TRC47206.1 MFS transporter [Mannheimia haemolytica]